MMRNVEEYAKFFLKLGMDDNPNTFDGNMKLQKLLFFANLINFSKNDNLLFQENMLAFKNGTVIEEVRKRYKNDFISFKEEARNFEPEFSESEMEVLNITSELFGKLSARELSDVNHQFDFWQYRLEESTNVFGYRDKEKAKITIEDIESEKSKIDMVINSYYDSKELGLLCELINGISFYYDPFEVDFELIQNQLENFAQEADEEAYTVSLENNMLVLM